MDYRDVFPGWEILLDKLCEWCTWYQTDELIPPLFRLVILTHWACGLYIPSDMNSMIELFRGTDSETRAIMLTHAIRKNNMTYIKTISQVLEIHLNDEAMRIILECCSHPTIDTVMDHTDFLERIQNISPDSALNEHMIVKIVKRLTN